MTKPKTTAGGKPTANEGPNEKEPTTGVEQATGSGNGTEPMDALSTPQQQVEHLAGRIADVTCELGNEAVEVVEKASGCPEIVKRDVAKALSTLKKAKLAELTIVLDHLRTVIPEGKPEESGKALGRTVRSVDIRDLVANCEGDITDTVDELCNWIVKEADLPNTVLLALYEKQNTFKNRDHKALLNLETEVLDRISSPADGQVIDFGRPTLDWDDQGLPPEMVKEQGELRARVADLETKLAEAESLAASFSGRIRALDLASRALGCEEPEVGSRTVSDALVHDLEVKLATAHSELTAMQAELRNVRNSNKDLQDLVDAYVQKDGGNPAGSYSSVDEHLWSLGYIRNAQGKLQRTATQGFNARHPYAAPSRNQAMPQLPPPEPFSGNFKSDKQSLGDFLERYERRVVNCSESDKVSLLSEYLVGEAKRAYRSVVSTHEGLTFYKLCKELKGMMVDSSRTGRLLKMKRFDDLKIRNGQTYLSFICLIESQVMDSYGDADNETIDQMKTKVLLNNIRERDLMMHVENALRTTKDDEDQFPVVKALAVSYERTAESASKWQSHGTGQSQGNPRYNAPRSNERPASTANGARPEVPAGGAPSSSPFACYNCKELGHKASECPKRSRGPPRTSGGNSAKFGNFKAPKCYACGEMGHMSPACPNKKGGKPVSSGVVSADAATAVPKSKVDSDLHGFASMCVGRTEAEIMQGIIGAPCVAPILVNGCEAQALFDTGSEVNIIGRAFLRDVLRSCDKKLLNFPCIRGHPSGLNIRDASGKVMPFAGVVSCELRTSKDDEPELHKFLVQDDPNFAVVLGTPTLLGSPKWRDRTSKLMLTWSGRNQPNKGVNASTNIYSMRVTVEKTEWSDVHVARSCYVRPGSHRTVRLQSNMKDAKALLVGDGVSFCTADSNGHLYATVFNDSTRMLSLLKGKHIARCVDATKVSIDEVEAEVDRQEGRAMIVGQGADAARRAAEVYEQVLEGSSGKTVLHANKDRVLRLFERFNDCFALTDFELGTTHLLEHEIVLKDGATPIAQHGRPVPLAFRKPLWEMLQQYLQMGVISPSKSDWSSPVVLVRKKDGSIRMCVDYRKLNKVVKLSQYPMPNISVMLQSLAGKKFFTTCDLHSGYWQIPLTPEAKELTAFSTLGGHWEFNVLPFGLSNAPGGFERAMESIFEEDLGKTVYLYLDDILIATETLEEHFQVVERVLTKLREYNLRLKPKKCAFLKTETAFLGHVISVDGLKVDAEKIEKILSFPVPRNATDVRSFLGICNYYRQFVRNFTLLSKPLREILTKGKWQWTQTEQVAFEELKKRMSSTPVLAQPDIEAAISGERPFILYTDASQDGVGAVLHQVGPDGKEHPIAYASKSCSQAERNYAITDLEALALIFALNKFKCFLLGTHVFARTDHQPLAALFRRSDLSGRAYRWALEIQEWNNLKIEYIQGRTNVVADALSRNVNPDSGDNTLTTQIKAVVMSMQVEPAWLEELKGEGWLKEVFEKPESDWQSLLREKSLLFEDCILYKLLTDGRKVIVVPQSQTRATFDRFHSGTLGGHAGWAKTVKMMAKYVYWPRMRNQIKQWVRKCFKCAQLNKQRKAVPPLKPIVSKRPYELVGIDVLSLGQTSSGNQYVVTVIDHHSKFCSAYPVSDKSAPVVAKTFWENWCLREGRLATSLLSDRGGEFLNEITDEVRKLSGMEQKFTIGHNPRENGCTERMNGTLKNLLMKMSDGVSEWDQRLPYALFVYNTSPHSTTGESPFFLLHGTDTNFPVCGSPTSVVSPYTVDLDTYKMELARGMKALYDVTAERIKAQAETMKRYYDRVNDVDKTQFQLFDRVFVFNPNVGADKESTKLTPPWEGPFRIVEMSENSATVRYLGPQKLEKRVQKDFLRKVHPEVEDDQFYLFKPDKKKGRPKGRKVAAETARKSGRSKMAVHFDD